MTVELSTRQIREDCGWCQHGEQFFVPCPTCKQDTRILKVSGSQALCHCHECGRNFNHAANPELIDGYQAHQAKKNTSNVKESARRLVTRILENELPDDPPEGPENEDGSLADVWRCQRCHKLNAWGWHTAEAAEQHYSEPVSVSHGSCFDNVCGHCGANHVRRDSPINAEVYTHTDPNSN